MIAITICAAIGFFTFGIPGAFIGAIIGAFISAAYSHKMDPLQREVDRQREERKP